MKIFVLDEYSPETLAMLQALYSRSNASVERHLEKVRTKGSAEFMRSYYVGYGHSSIGDCGNTTIFIEQISILACKAIQNTSLYSGQETSTRYIDFSCQTPIDPVGSVASRQIIQNWLDFYSRVRDQARVWLSQEYEMPAGVMPATWEKAVNARAFDVARGFLPAGVTSQLSWTTSLRHAHEHLLRLESHPLAEVVSIAHEIRANLASRYPSSFSHRLDNDQTAYQKKVGLAEDYFALSAGAKELPFFLSTVDNGELEAEAFDLIATRPKRTPLPKEFDRFGRVRLKFTLDFGSFRDLQRHRNGLCRMPILNGARGFHAWYLNQLPQGVRDDAANLIERQFAAIEELAKNEKLSPVDLQYYFPLGTLVGCELDYSLPQMVYVAELRSGVSVHPTLREVAQWMGSELARIHPSLKTYIDNSKDEFQIKRGHQDIVEISQ